MFGSGQCTSRTKNRQNYENLTKEISTNTSRNNSNNNNSNNNLLKELEELNKKQKVNYDIFEKYSEVIYNNLDENQKVIYDILKNYNYIKFLFELKRKHPIPSNNKKIKDLIEKINSLIDSDKVKVEGKIQILGDRLSEAMISCNKIIISNININNNKSQEKVKKMIELIIKILAEILVKILANRQLMNSNTKVGGSNEIVIKETKNAVRTPITYDQRRNNKNMHTNNAMANNRLYNKIYEN